ncbi:MAG: hypothetical protein PQJ46_00345, partial [Spirochaetales bacterium]|nr:hypothetical protein [Spirochaetales bacterium]
MKYQQIAFWFIAYSVLIAETVLSVVIYFSSKKKKEYKIVFRFIFSLFVMVVSVSFILFAYMLN